MGFFSRMFFSLLEGFFWGLSFASLVFHISYADDLWRTTLFGFGFLGVLITFYNLLKTNFGFIGTPFRSLGRLAVSAGFFGILQFQLVIETGVPLLEEKGFLSSIPDIEKALNISIPGSIRILTRDEYVVWERKTRYIPIESYDEIPPDLNNALIASEDEDFWEHAGVDPKGIFRAFQGILKDFKMGKGGSTIAMQVVKNITNQREKTVSRKLKEWFLAFKLVKLLTKEEILVLYWNWAYLGAGHQGPKSAAMYYWGLRLDQLSLSQCAILAGMVQSPERYRPDQLSDRKRLIRRRAYVLKRMLLEGYITQKQFDTAIAEPIWFNIEKPEPNYIYGWVIKMSKRVMYQVLTAEEIERGGFDIYITIDKHRQEIAWNSVVEGLKMVDKRQGFHLPLSSWTSFSSTPVQRGQKKRVAIIKKIDEDFITFELAGGAIGRLRSRHLPRYTLVSASAEKAYKKAKRRYNKQLRKWKRKKKGKKPESPREPKAKLIWEIGDKIHVAIVDQIGKTNRFWVTPDMGPQGLLVDYEASTGAYRALICGENSANYPLNRCRAMLQPGSTFKPIGVYLAAINGRVYTQWGTASQNNPLGIIDEERTYKYKIPWKEWDGKHGIGYDLKEWSPRNYGDKFTEDILPVRLALAKSTNSMAAHMITHEQIGWQTVQRTLRKLKVGVKFAPGPSIALGGPEIPPIELARTYGVLANYGEYRRPYIVEKIVWHKGGRVIDSPNMPKEEIDMPDLDEDDPEMAFERDRDLDFATSKKKLSRIGPAPFERVFAKDPIWIIRDMMRGVVLHGSGRRLKSLPLAIGGKTGTTNDSRNTWFVGVLDGEVKLAWVGFDNNDPLKGKRKAETGASAPLPIVKMAFEASLEQGDYENDPFVGESFRRMSPPPSGVVCLKIDERTGLLPEEYESEYFGDLKEEDAPPQKKKAAPDEKYCYLRGTEPVVTESNRFIPRPVADDEFDLDAQFPDGGVVEIHEGKVIPKKNDDLIHEHYDEDIPD